MARSKQDQLNFSYRLEKRQIKTFNRLFYLNFQLEKEWVHQEASIQITTSVLLPVSTRLCSRISSATGEGAPNDNATCSLTICVQHVLTLIQAYTVFPASGISRIIDENLSLFLFSLNMHPLKDRLSGAQMKWK